MQPARPSSRFSHLPRVFGRAALFLLPIAITISFFAYRFTHYNATNQFPTSEATKSVNPLDQIDITSSLARRPVFPFSIVPGGVRTPRQDALWHNPEEQARILSQQCLKERVMPADVAALVLFLASDDARMCTSQNYFVDAGWR